MVTAGILRWTVVRLWQLTLRLMAVVIQPVARRVVSLSIWDAVLLAVLAAAHRGVLSVQLWLSRLIPSAAQADRNAREEAAEESLTSLEKLRDTLELLTLKGDLTLLPRGFPIQGACEVLNHISTIANDQVFILNAHQEVKEWLNKAQLATADRNTVEDLLDSLQVDLHRSHYDNGIGHVNSAFTIEHKFDTALDTGQTGTATTILHIRAWLLEGRLGLTIRPGALHIMLDADVEWHWRSADGEVQEGTAMLPDFLNVACAAQRRSSNSRPAGLTSVSSMVSEASAFSGSVPGRAPFAKVVARLQGLANLSGLTPQAFLTFLMSIAFAEPRESTGRRYQQDEYSHSCLALRPALHLLSLAMSRQAQMQRDLDGMRGLPWTGPKAGSAPGRLQRDFVVERGWGEVGLGKRPMSEGCSVGSP